MIIFIYLRPNFRIHRNVSSIYIHNVFCKIQSKDDFNICSLSFSDADGINLIIPLILFPLLSLLLNLLCSKSDDPYVRPKPLRFRRQWYSFAHLSQKSPNIEPILVFIWWRCIHDDTSRFVNDHAHVNVANA